MKRTAPSPDDSMRNLPVLSLILMAFCIPSAAMPCHALPHHAETRMTHALSLGAPPKYGPGFEQFDYTRPHAPKGGELRRHAIGSFNNFNPFTAKGRPAAAFHLTDDTLCVRSLDEPYAVYGLIAEKMEFPRDRSWIVFHINPRARFHDGTAITAEDVVYSYNALNGNLGSAFRRFFRHVTDVRALDESRVRFSFSPRAPREMPLIVSTLQIYPKHCWSQRDISRTTLEIPVGSGPYRIKSYELGRNIVYERVRDYWAKDLPVRRWQHNFDTLRYEYFRDTTVAMEAFRAGLYDMRLEHSARYWDDLKKIEGVDILRLKHDQPQGVEGFFFNIRRKPFDDQLVRRALLLAFDWEWTNDHLLYGQYLRCDSYFSNSDLSAQASLAPPSGKEAELLLAHKAHLPPAVFKKSAGLPVSDGTGFNRANLVEAADLLKAAGWRIKNGKLVDAQNTPFRFRLLSNSQSMQRIAQPWFKNLSRLGIQASVHMVDSAQFIHRVQGYDYDMIASRFGQRLWPGQEQRLNWHSESARSPGARNLIGLEDPVIDNLVETLVNARDRAGLRAAGRALDRVLLAGDYVIPLGISTTYDLALRKGFGLPDTRPGYDLGEDCWWAATLSPRTEKDSQ